MVSTLAVLQPHPNESTVSAACKKANPNANIARRRRRRARADAKKKKVQSESDSEAECIMIDGIEYKKMSAQQLRLSIEVARSCKVCKKYINFNSKMWGRSCATRARIKAPFYHRDCFKKEYC